MFSQNDIQMPACHWSIQKSALLPSPPPTTLLIQSLNTEVELVPFSLVVVFKSYSVSICFWLVWFFQFAKMWWRFLFIRE